jgi:long-subunit fatty acid transport protein
MKKLLILVSFVAFSSATFAQEFGITAGATLATAKAEDKSSNLSIKSDSKVGFTVGVLANFPISTNFAFQPGLNFTQKGGENTETDAGITFKEKITLNYLELPLNFIYKFTEGFYVGLGPSLAYGLSGKIKTTETNEPDQEEDVKFGNDENEDDLKAFEFGGNILAGYQLANGIFFTVNYNTGFSDLSLDNTVSFKNRYFGIKIGKMFGNGGKK